MATMITSECINCGACEPECPNTAIYQGGAEWEFNGAKHAALTNEIFYIVPEKCTECVGFFDHEACAAVCPVDCCVPNPEIPESEAQLIERARQLHPGTDFGASFPSRFGGAAGGEAAVAPAAAPAAKPAAPAPAAPAPAPVADAGSGLSLPAVEEWEVPVDCFRCQGTYGVPFKHVRSGVVLYCPFCNGSYVVTTELHGQVSRALREFHERWTRDFEAMQDRRRRELEQFEERQRRALEEFNEVLLRASRNVKPPGAPRKKAWIFG